MNKKIWVYCGTESGIAGYILPSKEDVTPPVHYIEYIRADAHEQIIEQWKIEEQMWRDADKKQLGDIERLRIELEQTRNDEIEARRHDVSQLNEIESMQVVINKLNARIVELEAAQRCIPVDERLPNEGEIVPVVITGGYRWPHQWNLEEPINSCATYDGDMWYTIDNDGDDPIWWTVTHWMPLPPPPATNTENTP